MVTLFSATHPAHAAHNFTSGTGAAAGGLLYVGRTALLLRRAALTTTGPLLTTEHFMYYSMAVDNSAQVTMRVSLVLREKEGRHRVNVQVRRTGEQAQPRGGEATLPLP